MVPCPAVLTLTIGLTCIAPVELIVDGHTAWMRFADQSRKVRILGIDTPERGEPGFKAAKLAARARREGHTAQLTIGGAKVRRKGKCYGSAVLDRYGRVLAAVDRWPYPGSPPGNARGF